jgi:glycosyltransferase involved in cell wall biosynthesis
VKLHEFEIWAIQNDDTYWAKLRRLFLQITAPLRYGRRRELHVIVAYDPYASGIAALVASLLLRIPFVIEMNGDYHEAPPSAGRAKSLIMRRVLDLTMSRATAIRVLNSSQERFVREAYKRARVYKFADFAALSTFEAAGPKDEDYLLSVGYPFDLKGMDILVNAFRRVSARFPGVGLRIMGHATPQELERFRQLASGLPVTFVRPGPLPEVAHQMSGAIALVNAARTEALGRVHLEAMACSKPVIASCTNGAREVITDGVTGLLFPIGDEVALADSISRLLSDRQSAKVMGAAGKRRVKELYSEEIFTKNFTRMLRDVVDGGPRSGKAPPHD